MNRRVCIQTAAGALASACYAQYARAGDAWVPVPEGRSDLAIVDESRPIGTHPQVWYGWPRGPADTRGEWLVTSEHGASLVRAWSYEGALAGSGFQTHEVTGVELLERWY